MFVYSPVNSMINGVEISRAQVTSSLNGVFALFISILDFRASYCYSKLLCLVIHHLALLPVCSAGFDLLTVVFLVVQTGHFVSSGQILVRSDYVSSASVREYHQLPDIQDRTLGGVLGT